LFASVFPHLDGKENVPGEIRSRLELVGIASWRSMEVIFLGLRTHLEKI